MHVFVFVRIFNLYTCQIKRFFMLAELITLVHCGYRGDQPLILISTKKKSFRFPALIALSNYLQVLTVVTITMWKIE